MGKLTLTIAKGDAVEVGPHRLELMEVTSNGYAVVEWTGPEGDKRLRALEHPAHYDGPTDWLELDDQARVALSRNARARATQARLTFDAPREVPIVRVKD